MIPAGGGGALQLRREEGRKKSLTLINSGVTKEREGNALLKGKLSLRGGGRKDPGENCWPLGR